MKKNLNKYFPWLIIIGITVFYFEYAVTITWDSAHYMSYVNIFEGILPWDSWDVVRGPIFPLIIYIGNILFGKTSQGLIIHTYFYYIIMLCFCYKILLTFLENDKNLKKKNKTTIINIFLLIFIIINPIIFGFYHTLLTEFVAITLSVISCYFAYSLLNIEYQSDKKRFIIYTIAFSFLIIFSWFLKQPYVSCALFPFIVTNLISILEKRDIKNIVSRIVSIVISLIVLIVSINAWNKTLSSTGNNPNTSRNPTNSLGNQMLKAVEILKIDNSDEIYSNDYIKKSKLSKKEKKDISTLKEKNYVIIKIYDGKKHIEDDYIECSNGNISTLQSIFYIMETFFKKPAKVLESYTINYLTTINVFSSVTENGVAHNTTGKFDFDYANEIITIAYRPYNYGMSNIFYITDEMMSRVECYEQPNYVFKGINYIMRLLGNIFNILFKIFFLLLPLLLICSILMRKILTKSEVSTKKRLNLIIILLSYSFLHVLLHVVTAATIDRYIIPAFITTMLGTFMLIYLLLNRIIFKKNVRS